MYKSWFTQKREQFGHDWLKKIKPDELQKNAERILSDLARYNMTDLDMQDLRTNMHVIDALISFSNTRYCHYNRMYVAMDMYLKANTAPDWAVTYQSLYCIQYIYSVILFYLNEYKKSGCDGYLETLKLEMGKFDSYICPGKLM